MGLDIKNLTVRTISGLIYAGLLIGAIVLGQIAMAIVASLLAVGASYELGRPTVGRNNPGSWWVTWILDAVTLIFLIFSFIAIHDSRFIVCTVIFVLLVFIRFLIQIFLDQHNPLQSIALFTFQQVYVGLPLGLLVASIGVVPSPWIIVCAVAMIWISDTGAYFVGSLFGRHRLFERLSPKKSWEGFLGGLAFNIGAAFIFFYCFHLNQGLFISNVSGWIFIGICVTAFATLGDLFESMLKRSLDIKDFGHIIPGHGGVLDRIDSLLCVVPCVILSVALASWMFGL